MEENEALNKEFKSEFRFNRNYDPITCCLFYLLDMHRFPWVMGPLGYNIRLEPHCWKNHIPFLDMLFLYSNDKTYISFNLFENYLKYYSIDNAFKLSKFTGHGSKNLINELYYKYQKPETDEILIKIKRPLKNTIHHKLFKASYNGDIKTLKELLNKNKKIKKIF